MSEQKTIDAPVLIVGAGLVGLSAAMFLAQHGVRTLSVERLRGGSPLPRAAHFHLRTIELFRLAAIEDQVKAQSAREFWRVHCGAHPLRRQAINAADAINGRTALVVKRVCAEERP